MLPIKDILARLTVHKAWVSWLLGAAFAAIEFFAGDSLKAFAKQTGLSLLETQISMVSVVLVGAAIGAIVVGVFLTQKAAFDIRMETLERQLRTDAKTGAVSETGLKKSFAARTEALSDEVQCFALVFLDLVQFGDVNKVHDHIAGDHILRDFVTFLRKSLYGSDTVGRSGGDEFVLLLKGSAKEAIGCVQKLMRELQKERFYVGGDKLGQVSVRAGITECERGETFEQCVGRASRALNLVREGKSKGYGEKMMSVRTRQDELR